jgi:hypothetical protein
MVAELAGVIRVDKNKRESAINGTKFLKRRGHIAPPYSLP